MEQELKNKIYDHLNRFCRGRSHPKKATELAGLFQINLREVNDIIRKLRKDGILIGSAKEPPHGYYLPITEEEIKEYLNSFKSELYDMLQTFNRQKRAKKAYLENLQMGDLFNFEPDPAGQLMFK
ncbi:MAG: hypothetical protein PHI86_00050 [Candidatus Omnitrophica bacterium]|nr:hypothetical protein [Candidatus Omnitrophota bacterium]